MNCQLDLKHLPNQTVKIKITFARVLKIKLSETNNKTTYYIGDLIHIRITNNTIFNESYFYHNSQLIAKKDNGGNINFYHPDHLGSTSLVTNESGNVVEEEFYLPFGSVLEGAEESRYLFTGKEKDKTTNLDYFGARYYDSNLRHFVQADSLIADIYDPQNLNRYSYTLNNPYKYVDESGNVAVPVIVYTIAEGLIDVGSLGYSLYVLVGDRQSVVNWLAVGADVQDILSGPISNPGPSGPLVRSGAQAAEGFEKKLATKGIEGAIIEELRNVEDKIKERSDKLSLDIKENLGLSKKDDETSENEFNFRELGDKEEYFNNQFYGGYISNTNDPGDDGVIYCYGCGSQFANQDNKNSKIEHENKKQ